MTADNFVKIVRGKSDKLRVDDILLKIADKEFHGKGLLRIEPGKLEIDMTLNAKELPPPQLEGVFTPRDCWQLTGTIQNHLRFKSQVGPSANRSSFSQTGPDGNAELYHTLTFDLHPIELIPTKMDSMSRKERAAMWKQIEKQNKTKQPKRKQSVRQYQKTSLFHLMHYSMNILLFLQLGARNSRAN